MPGFSFLVAALYAGDIQLIDEPSHPDPRDSVHVYAQDIHSPTRYCLRCARAAIRPSGPPHGQAGSTGSCARPSARLLPEPLRQVAMPAFGLRCGIRSTGRPYSPRRPTAAAAATDTPPLAVSAVTPANSSPPARSPHRRVLSRAAVRVRFAPPPPPALRQAAGRGGNPIIGADSCHR